MRDSNLLVHSLTLSLLLFHTYARTGYNKNKLSCQVTSKVISCCCCCRRRATHAPLKNIIHFLILFPNSSRAPPINKQRRENQRIYKFRAVSGTGLFIITGLKYYFPFPLRQGAISRSRSELFGVCCAQNTVLEKHQVRKIAPTNGGK